MASSRGNGTVGVSDSAIASHTLTALKRWSCVDGELPSVEQIRSVHIYDFDNTLFASPLPNKQIWNGPTLGQLQNPDLFVNGAWWHDPAILACTGEGIEKEEPRAWDGWWNEQIVSLVELTMQQSDALNVLLTGRSESRFADLVQRIVASRKLDFHMVCLKPAVGPRGQKFSSTMLFKQELLKDLVYTYREAEEIRIYEDRPRHVAGFRSFFESFNRTLLSPNPPISRPTISAEVIQVPDNSTTLDPVTEVAEVQKLINSHNAAVRDGSAPPGAQPLQIKRTAFYTGYLVQPPFVERLLSLVKVPSGTRLTSDIRYLGNSIVITPRACPNHLLQKVGGIGKKMTWRVTGLSCLWDKIWAARVEPVPATEKYHSQNKPPILVLAHRNNARPADASSIRDWEPVSEDQPIEFETVVGEKVLLRIEREEPYDRNFDRNAYQSATTNGKRPFTNEDDFPPLGESQSENRQPPHSRPQPHHRNDDNRRPGGGVPAHNRDRDRDRGGYHGRGRGGPRGGAQGARGGKGGHGRGGGGNAGRGRGRGGYAQYKSLDDMSDRQYYGSGYADHDGAGNGHGRQREEGLYNAY